MMELLAVLFLTHAVPMVASRDDERGEVATVAAAPTTEGAQPLRSDSVVQENLTPYSSMKKSTCSSETADCVQWLTEMGDWDLPINANLLCAAALHSRCGAQLSYSYNRHADLVTVTAAYDHGTASVVATTSEVRSALQDMYVEPSQSDEQPQPVEGAKVRTFQTTEKPPIWEDGERRHSLNEIVDF